MRYVTPRATFWKNGSLGFFPENHSKYHVAIDLHKEEGKALFRQLAARADVLIENFRAGTLDRWGIGYRDLSALNPRLVYVANSGFGQWGPFSLGRPSYDGVAQVVSGMAGITGFPGRPPLLCGIFIGDWFGGLMAATAALVALHHRRRTGEGQFIDYAQSEGLIRSLDWTWVLAGLSGESRGPAGNRDRALGASDIVRCRDGFVAIAAVTDGEFRALCRALEAPDLGRRSALRHAGGAARAGPHGGDPRPGARVGGGPDPGGRRGARREARLRRGAGRQRGRPLRRPAPPRAGGHVGVRGPDLRAHGRAGPGAQAVGDAGAHPLDRPAGRLAQRPRLPDDPRALAGGDRRR